eukprot:425778-Pyramimonas_sp.AAC.1
MAGHPLTFTEQAKVDMQNMTLVMAAVGQQLPHHRYVDGLLADISEVLVGRAKLDSVLLHDLGAQGNDLMSVQVRCDKLCELYQE